jgi:membrane fusion protein (multidrug efflux system)
MNDAMESKNEQQVPAETPGRNTRIKGLVLVGGILAAAAGTWYYLQSRAYESTDNAFIAGDVVQISPRVPGQMLRVHVKDNQHVNRGDLIAEIDPSDYETQLAQAKARLKDTGAHESGAQSGLELTSSITGAVLVQAGAGLEAAGDQVHVLKARLAQDEAVVHAAEAGLQQAEARQTAAEAEARRASDDAVRYRTLHEKDEVSRQLLDRAETDARASSANLEAVRQMVAAAKAQLGQAKAGYSASVASLSLVEKQVRQAQGKLEEAQTAPQQVRVRQSDLQSAKAQQEQQNAAVRQAELDFSYTKIYAPESGYITKKSVEPGNFVQTGQALMALVSDRLWVVANFKETQLENMRTGQPATVKVDAYPQLKLRGRVDSIQSGSGAQFSLLPPENATGNYVKIVQRVPVKILLDAIPSQEYRLGPGLSVIPEVKIR